MQTFAQFCKNGVPGFREPLWIPRDPPGSPAWFPARFYSPRQYPLLQSIQTPDKIHHSKVTYAIIPYSYLYQG